MNRVMNRVMSPVNGLPKVAPNERQRERAKHDVDPATTPVKLTVG
jgi:hypothetical protein